MRVLPTDLPGVLLIEPDVFRDSRGYFLETFHERKYRDAGVAYSFVQDNQSRSVRATLRGMHAQLKKPQGKLVRVLHGEIFDVAVDIRPRSPTFGKWASATLSAESFRQMFIPPGFAHGFCVLSDFADVEYKCTDFYDRSDEIGFRWDDPAVGIAWPIDRPVLSDRDAALPTLAELRQRLSA
ncbi:MAG TPA: dTDP-4-dehydrorhamnose 3,5-epimerase [Myxococcales bacterium]|jgi:dTDP-4-dehydrorhamnose 3,5-epimerase|nr:dTDP-4-dehydrorhamnose 3,5-epimerase [Myxococcales bacterium]